MGLRDVRAGVSGDTPDFPGVGILAVHPSAAPVAVRPSADAATDLTGYEVERGRARCWAAGGAGGRLDWWVGRGLVFPGPRVALPGTGRPGG